MKKLTFIFLSLFSCTNYTNEISIKNKPHINLKLMVVSTNQKVFFSGYAVYGEVINKANCDIAFQMPTMYIEKLTSKEKWEVLWPVFPDGIFITSTNESTTNPSNILHKKLPYEWNDMDSFLKHNKNNSITNAVLKSLNVQPNSFNINEFSSYGKYFSFIMKDSTLSFSRNINSLVNINNKFAREILKKGEYRVFFREREEEKLDSINLLNEKNKKEAMCFPSQFGNFKVINRKFISSDTLYFKIY